MALNHSPAAFVARRVLHCLPLLVGVTLCAFLLGHLAPGDPAYFALAGDGFFEPTAEELSLMRERLGLDQPLGVQYARWIVRAMGGDLGTSFRTGSPVRAEIAGRIPVTLAVAVPAVMVAGLVGVVLGTLAGARPHSVSSGIIDAWSGALIATPAFVLAVVLIIVVAERVRWIPVAGFGTPAHLLLPVLVLASGTTGVTTRLMRSGILEESAKRFAWYAHSRGLAFAAVLVRHIVPSALPPITTFLANAFAGILGGSVIIESIFALPGLGTWVIAGVLNRDLPVVQAYVLLTGLAYVIAQLAADLAAGLIDPRVRSAARST